MVVILQGKCLFPLLIQLLGRFFPEQQQEEEDCEGDKDTHFNNAKLETSCDTDMDGLNAGQI